MSGSGANSTVSHPGKDWHMLWGNGPILEAFQLDIVGFLAILGEESVKANAQVAALSKLIYLPRLLPAPQAFLRTERPKELVPGNGNVTGVYSGMNKPHIHHVADILFEKNMPAFTVRCVVVTKKTEGEDKSELDTAPKGLHVEGEDRSSQNSRVEKGTVTPARASLLRGIRRALTWAFSGTNQEDQKLADASGVRVKNNTFGPLFYVSWFGCFLASALFVLSILLGDGMSLLSVLLLSLLSTLVGVVNKSKLKLPTRQQQKEEQPGDLVVRYPNGSFLVVRCKEEVARELFFAPEEIIYRVQDDWQFRLLSLVGTIMLMFGVIFLANAKLQLQFAWGGAYIILNVSHWIAAALPQKWHWNLTAYEVMDEELDVTSVLEKPSSEGTSEKREPHVGYTASNFTTALWWALVFTKSSEWVFPNNAAPKTEVWSKWIEKATSEAVNCKEATGSQGRMENEAPSASQAGMERPGVEKPRVWKLSPWQAKPAWDDLNREHMSQEEARKAKKATKIGDSNATAGPSDSGTSTGVDTSPPSGLQPRGTKGDTTTGAQEIGRDEL